jgi:SAM-dependent methyltransferase
MKRAAVPPAGESGTVGRAAGAGPPPRRGVGFQEQEVADYERRRYRGLDQRLVHGRELRVLRRLLAMCSPATIWSGAVPSGEAEPGRALDAPCGYGRFSRLLAGEGYSLFATDLSLAMVRRASAPRPDDTVPIGIVSNLTRGLPFRPASFSLVFSLRFFHHLHDSPARRLALSEFARVSREWLIVSYYQSNALHLVQRALRRKLMRKRTRIKMIRGREFREEAESAGFEVVRVVPLFRGLHAQHIALLRKAVG